MDWNNVTLQQYAPNNLVLNRARALFFGRRWKETASDGTVLWGTCQSTGARVYEALVLLDGSAYRCTCKSRHQPCQHVISLLLFFIRKNDQITPADHRPSWVQQALREPAAPAVPPPPTRQRLEQRIPLMEQGVEALDQWLKDVTRQGLSTLEGQGAAFWERPAARMVDAKLGGVARRIRGFADLVGAPDWHNRLLEELAELYLFVQSFRQLQGLPRPLQDDLLSYGGVNFKKEEVLEAPGVTDNWLVVGLVEGEEENLRYRRTWLMGERSQRFALLLDFAFGNNRFEGNWVLGSALQGELVFYPGAYPLRALVKKVRPYRNPFDGLLATPNAEALLENYAQALSEQPWIGNFPVLLEQVQIIPTPGGLALIDAQNATLPVETAAEHQWVALSVAGAAPLPLFGEWAGAAFRPLSAFEGGRVIQLQQRPPTAFEEEF